MQNEETKKSKIENDSESEKEIIKDEKIKNKYFTSKNITRIAVFTAISYILYMFIKFNLPFFPSFLDIQISDFPALLAGFMMGPMSGALVIILKIALKLPFSSTACVGELADLLLGLAFVLPSAIFYKYNRTKKGAVIALTIGSICCIITAVLSNWLILIPFYSYRYGGFESIVKLISKLYSGIGEVTVDNFYTYYILLAVIPFNILRCLLSSIVTFLVYKKTEKIFDKMFQRQYQKEK